MSDDNVPITVPWLRSLGFEPSRDYPSRFNCWTTPALSPVVIRVAVDADDGVSWIMADGTNVGSPNPRRVHIRQLLSAIGDPVEEGR